MNLDPSVADLSTRRDFLRGSVSSLTLLGGAASGAAWAQGNQRPAIGIVRQQQFAFNVVMNIPILRPDGQNWNGQVLTALQNAPLGWVKAGNEVVKKFPFQRVNEMEFAVNGKKLPFSANPAAGDVDYWTVREPERERLHNLDQVAVVWKASNAKQDTLTGTYKGVSIKPIYGPLAAGAKAVLPPDTLSHAALQSLLSLDEVGMAMTPEQRTRLLELIKTNGLLYDKERESVTEYVKRYLTWVNANCFYSAANPDSNPISFFENKAVPGNCNKFAFPAVYVFRIQGIPAQLLHGPKLHSGILHSDCLALDQTSAAWVYVPGANAANNHGRGVGLGILSPLPCFWFSSYLSVRYANGGRGSVGAGTSGPGWYVFEGPTASHRITQNFDPKLSIVREIQSGDPQYLTFSR